MKFTTLIAFGLVVLTGFLIWRPGGQTVPSSKPATESAAADKLAGQAVPPPNSKPATELAAVDKPAAQVTPPPSSKPATKPAAADKVVATVNGEPIFESELVASLPDDAFQAQLDEQKASKLRRLVEETVEWQFLKDRKVTLSDEEFEKAAADFETMVKTPGCPCCGGGFASVEEFMQVNAFSPQEFHRRIICDSGLKLYAARLAKEQTSPQALAETVQKHRAEIEKDRVMAYTISFDYTRDGVYSRNDKTVQAKKEKIANEALARLKKGESFEKVAREMSDDEMSGPKGGALECVRAEYLAPEVQEVVSTLEPGKFSPVIKTAWGCSIVMRKKLTDEDILAVVKERAKNSADDQMYRELDAWRKQTKIQYSAASAPASAAVKSVAK